MIQTDVHRDVRRFFIGERGGCFFSLFIQNVPVCFLLSSAPWCCCRETEVPDGRLDSPSSSIIRRAETTGECVHVFTTRSKMSFFFPRMNSPRLRLPTIFSTDFDLLINSLMNGFIVCFRIGRKTARGDFCKSPS